MDLCGEHGFRSIAFSTERGGSCPACEQVEELEAKINKLEEENADLDLERDMAQGELDIANEKIYSLTNDKGTK